ncbi:MAG: acyltransferase [Mobilicoccus sp.]|nr:acyltransferase [Mobilicoccus sp.]
MSTAQTAAAGSRLEWIDAARGLAVAAVVLLHVSIGHFYGLPHADENVLPIWDRINQIVGLIRMPLLFVVSGMLAAGKIRRGFSRGNAVLSAATNYYLYLVWLLVYGLFFVLSGDVHLPFNPASFGDYAIQVFVPQTPLWFVFCLAAYVVVFTSLRRVPPSVIVASTVLISLVAATTWDVTSPLWTRGILYVAFFAFGVYGKDALLRFAPRPWVFLVSATAAFLLFHLVTLEVIMTPEPLTWAQAPVQLALELFASIAGLSGTVLLCHLAVWRRAGSWTGRHTLAIYVMHVPVILAVQLPVRFGMFPLIPHLTGTYAWFAWLYPLLLTAVVIIVCVWLEKLLTAIHLDYLFRLPSRYRRALYRRPDGTRPRPRS